MDLWKVNTRRVKPYSKISLMEALQLFSYFLVLWREIYFLGICLDILVTRRSIWCVCEETQSTQTPQSSENNTGRIPYLGDESLSSLANRVNTKQVFKLTNMINRKAPDCYSVLAAALAARCVQNLHSAKHTLTAKAATLIIPLTYVDGVCY